MPVPEVAEILTQQFVDDFVKEVEKLIEQRQAIDRRLQAGLSILQQAKAAKRTFSEETLESVQFLVYGRRKNTPALFRS